MPEQKTSAADRKEEQDAITRSIGNTGRWQIQLIVILSLLNIPCTWHIFVITFQTLVPDFWCAPPPEFAALPPGLWRNKTHTPSVNHNARDNPCLIWDVDYKNMTLEELLSPNFPTGNEKMRKCTEWVYQESVPDQTVVSQWDLVCSRKKLAHTAEMSFLVGVAIGGLTSGMISDRFGRKKTIMSLLCLQAATGLAIAFVPILEVFFLLRAFLGVVSVGLVFSGFVLCVEIVGGKWRTIAGVTYLVPVPLSYILIAGLGYYVRSWKDIQIAVSAPWILFLGFWWIIPESPRWLLAMGKIDEIIEVLKEAARVNKRTLPPNIDKLLQQGINQGTGDRHSVLDILRHPKLRKISLIMSVTWFSVYFIYFGLVMNLSNIGGDVYVNTVISGAVELPSMVISVIVLLKLGRRWPLAATLFFSGISCLMTIPFGHFAEWITISFAMLGKFIITSSNVISPIYTAELYPTVVRNLGVGLANVTAGIALVLVPFIWDFADIDPRLPMSFLGISGIVGGLSVLVLEETANRALKESVDDC